MNSRKGRSNILSGSNLLGVRMHRESLACMQDAYIGMVKDGRQ